MVLSSRSSLFTASPWGPETDALSTGRSARGALEAKIRLQSSQPFLDGISSTKPVKPSSPGGRLQVGAPSSGHRVTALLPHRTRPLAAEAPGCGQELGFRAGTRSITRHGEQDLELGDIILGDTGLARDSPQCCKYLCQPQDGKTPRLSELAYLGPIRCQCESGARSPEETPKATCPRCHQSEGRPESAWGGRHPLHTPSMWTK